MAYPAMQVFEARLESLPVVLPCHAVHARRGFPLLQRYATDRARARLVAHDPELSPLDLAVAPNGNIVVSSERPSRLARSTQ